MAKYVYGKNVVRNLLKHSPDVICLYIQAGRNDDEIEKMAIRENVPVKHVARVQLDRMADANHQGYIAEIKDYRTYEIDEIIESIPEGKMPLLVALDSIQDPHNLGAVLRTMECVGGDGVIIEKNRSVSLNGTVAKVSVGAIDTVKVAQVTNLAQTLRSLKKKGYWVVGTDMEDAVDYRSVDYKMPVVLVIGSEGSGMRKLIAEQCDYKVVLPMQGQIGSLNASVACGVMLYEIYSQRFPYK